MSKQYDNIESELALWLGQQRVFFVATAPLSGDGYINASPKGGESFRVLGPMEVVYQDYTGSGCETIAHLRENGRIILMFCALEGAPTSTHASRPPASSASTQATSSAGLWLPTHL